METDQAELSNPNAKLLSENKSLQEELERTKQELESVRTNQKKAQSRERELNQRLQRRDSTIDQLKKELKDTKPRKEEEVNSVAIIESGKKRKAEISEKRPVENTRDPRQKPASKARKLEEFSLQTNESFFQSGIPINPWQESPKNCFDQRRQAPPRQSRGQSYDNSNTHFYQQSQYYQFYYQNYSLYRSGNIHSQYNPNNTS